MKSEQQEEKEFLILLDSLKEVIIRQEGAEKPNFFWEISWGEEVSALDLDTNHHNPPKDITLQIWCKLPEETGVKMIRLINNHNEAL